ncbi:VirB4 family type IV secretion/conjugal transfer ATPase [Desulfopila sp. IMCC35006]|uniref:VirB4 family type IV secretion/conjugal transfer ATPase n=1 Tax=Desulfopila sp. IMCC35006 TaxID=2569542 RepID=UPI0010AC80F0|nr:VirB4 family type IV secretion system protein [Desulfopila sp. IMCC35006]TKB23472.1 VirB4 family type IV secretion/conjugal transfer ATPase [Desulfopila sp. IMCC35006]
MAATFKFSKAFAQEESTSSFIPYTSQVTTNVVKLKNGDYSATIKMQGAAHESADIEDINSWHDQLNGLLRNISSPNVAIWSHVVRRKYSSYPAGDFTPGFCKHFNEKYQKYMAQEPMLVNELYLTIIYRPQPIKALKILGLFEKRNKKETENHQSDDIATLEEITGVAIASLERYEPELLGCYEHNGFVYSEVLEFYSFLVNGEWHRFPLARANISEIMATSRPFFGKVGLMSLKGPTRTQYAGIVTIQEYPSISFPGILNNLFSVPFEFVLSQSFTFLSKPVAMGRMKRQQARMVNAGDVAVSQIDAIDQALDDLASNLFVMGAHSLSLLIFGDDKKTLNDSINIAGTAISDVGMKWAREEIGIAGAFWAQLPGNFQFRVRVGDITSRNFVAFSSFHNFPTGRIKGNQWGDAVTMFKTTSGAPFYFSFHKGSTDKNDKLDPNHKDLANTVVIGKSGTGKTVLEMMLLAQTQKFNQPQNGKKLSCIVFDKDLGAAVGIRAMGGRYYPLKNGLPTGFNPFQMTPSPNNISFLELLVKQLVKHEGVPITLNQEREISQAIAGLMAVSQEKRKIGALLEFFDPTEENGLHIRLSRWCGDGVYGWLFDNKEDTLDLDNCPMVGFDVTEFLENESTRTPTIMYLFHRIENLIDGRRIPIFMDEFWKLLDDEAFQDLAQNKLVTIRKQDGFLVMFTQSPTQVLRSKIAFAIIGQTATKIFLPNPEATRKDYVEGFRLSEREYEIVKSLGEKSRCFLIKQGKNSAVAELNLRGFEDELAVLSGNTATSALAEKLVSEHGTDPEVWLPEFQRLRKNLL